MRYLALLVLSSACDVSSPTVDAPPSVESDAEMHMDDIARGKSFDNIVRPLVTECATGPCHTGQPPLLTSYAAMTAVPANLAKYTARPGNANILVTKGGVDNTHMGLDYFSPLEQAQVAAWIDSL